MPRQITITGGAGFVGCHLVRRLVQDGASVTVLDDLSAPSDMGLPDEPGLTLVQADVRDGAAVARVVAGADLVLHLASVVGVEAVTADPQRTESVILDGTARVLEACRGSQTPLLFLSTSEVTDAPRSGPRAVYGEAKRAAEELLMAAAHSLPITIVRPFNIVGPGQAAPGMVLPALARAARAGLPLPVHGSGEQQRSFLHVEDLVEVLAEVSSRPAPLGGELLEVGSEERLSISALAGRLASLAGSGAVVSRQSPCPRREDLPRRAPDLAELRRRVDFRPRWSLDAILRDALAHA
ncbi:MAG: nucleoside-diphosphate-sugar epimerase [Pseudohongiellaceae bacterium]|jgi:nucleoside-diphosphate-sugar epimerase